MFWGRVGPLEVFWCFGGWGVWNFWSFTGRCGLSSVFRGVGAFGGWGLYGVTGRVYLERSGVRAPQRPPGTHLAP